MGAGMPARKIFLVSPSGDGFGNPRHLHACPQLHDDGGEDR